MQTTRVSPVTASALARFNAASIDEVIRTLLTCLNSHHWAHRLASHHPYPDLPSLLAAADEAAYDLSPDDLTEALATEVLPPPPRGHVRSGPHGTECGVRRGTRPGSDTRSSSAWTAWPRTRPWTTYWQASGHD